MPQATRTDPPYVPIRGTGWPARRTSPAVIAVAIVLLAAAVAVALVHHPTRAERASDLRGFLQVVNSDIESCAGGVGESLAALHQIDAGTSQDRADAVTIARTGASNCSPANNELIDDLEGYEVPESLSSFHLQAAVTALVNWAAPDAEQVQADAADLLAAPTPAARQVARGALRQALARLDAQRATADSVLDSAIRSVALSAAPPRLPG